MRLPSMTAFVGASMLSLVSMAAQAAVPTGVTLSVGTVGVSTADGVRHLDLGDSGGNARLWGSRTIRDSYGTSVAMTERSGYEGDAGIYHGNPSGGPKAPVTPQGTVWDRNYVSVGYDHYGGVTYSLAFKTDTGVAANQNYFGFLLSGMRAADTISFAASNSVVARLTGSDILAAAGAGGSLAKPYYVNLSFADGLVFDRVTITNSKQFQASSTDHFVSMADIAYGSLTATSSPPGGGQAMEPVEAPAPVLGGTPLGSGLTAGFLACALLLTRRRSVATGVTGQGA